MYVPLYTFSIHITKLNQLVYFYQMKILYMLSMQPLLYFPLTYTLQMSFSLLNFHLIQFKFQNYVRPSIVQFIFFDKKCVLQDLKSQQAIGLASEMDC